MNENKKPVIEGHVIFFCFLLLVILCAFMGKVVFGLAGVSVYDACKGFQSCGSIKSPFIINNKEIIWTEQMEQERIALEKAKEKKPVKVTPKVEKKQEPIKEVKIDTSFDLDRLAKAVAMAETGNCTKGYGKTYSNCFGIKNGKTAPCPKVGRNKMCIYEKPEDSYKAFKIIWGTHYKIMPNLGLAKRWTGHDNAVRWLGHVNHFYDKLQ